MVIVSKIDNQLLTEAIKREAGNFDNFYVVVKKGRAKPMNYCCDTTAIFSDDGKLCGAVIRIDETHDPITTTIHYYHESYHADKHKEQKGVDINNFREDNRRLRHQIASIYAYSRFFKLLLLLKLNK